MDTDIGDPAVEDTATDGIVDDISAVDSTIPTDATLIVTKKKSKKTV